MADTKLAKVGITVKESWENDISYEVLDYTLWRVQDGGDGCGYIAKRANIGVVPNSDDSVWIKATQAGQSIYDLAVKYGHFEGTEEEFEAEYQSVLQAARDAASETSATNTEIQEAEELRKTAENARVEAETERQTAESGRQTAETARQTAETARDTAETQRGDNETTRQSQETARESAEQTRQTNESTRQSNETARESAEQERTADFEALKTDMETAIGEADAATADAVALNNQVAGDESARQQAEQSRVAAETQRASAETQRGTNEQTRQTQETARQTAEQTRNTQEGTRQTQETARQTAEQGRAGAESQRVSNETDRQQAETARESQATTDHQRAEDDHAVMAGYDTRLTNAETEVSQLEAKLYVKSKKNLLSFLNRVDASPTGAWPITKYDITEGVWYRGYSYSGYIYSAAPANQVQIDTVTPTSLSFTQPVANYGLGLLVRVKGNTTYTLSVQTGGNPNSATRRIVEIDSSGNAIKNYGPSSFPSTFTTDENCVAIILCIYKASANASITISNWMLEEGDEATDFEPADVFITTDEQQCERESNKVSKISTGDSVKYPSTKAVVDYVHDETRETIDTTNYTGGTALDKTIFDVKNGDVVIVNTSASFPSGLKFTVVANGETVQTKNYYSAVSNDRLNITADGTLKMSASSANTNNATIVVSLLNYGAIVERLVELVGNYAPDVASFELTNPAVKGFIDTVTYDNSDYTYTQVSDYNAKKQYRTDQPLPVTIRWIPEDVIDTYILVSENTPVVPVTWESNQAPKSDFWFRVPSGVFSFDIYNLIPGKTYYYGVYGVVASGVKTLKEGSFATTGSVRMLKVDYLQNIRDLGGWAVPGGTVKYDRIFRGDAIDELSRLSHYSQGGLIEFGVRIVIREDIDLRGNQSFKINGSGEIVNASPFGDMATYFPAGIQPYATGLQNSGATIASIFEEINSALTESKPRKIYFHCSGGCDRTGTLAFLILGLLGVSESDLSKEYELSTFANALGYPLGKYRTRDSTVYPFSGMVDAIKQYAGATLADKIEAYLLGVGVSQTTIDSLRSELIETS